MSILRRVLSATPLAGRLRSLVGARKAAPEIVPLDQVWPHRRAIMERFVTAAFRRPVAALEIGTWFGIGSTQIWLQRLLPGSSLLLVDAWTPYSSAEDHDDWGFDYAKLDELTADAFASTFAKVREHEGGPRGRDVRVQVVRARSYEFLPLLKDDSFDFIYIDGDHKYAQVKQDIQQARRLVRKDYGVICGDDLEKLPTPQLIAVARQHLNRDALREPNNFHPGVLLAIAEEFGSVNMVNGFWWITCSNGAFTTEVLGPDVVKGENEQ